MGIVLILYSLIEWMNNDYQLNNKSTSYYHKRATMGVAI